MLLTDINTEQGTLEVVIFCGPGTEDIVSTAITLYCNNDLPIELIVVSPCNIDFVNQGTPANTLLIRDDSITGFSEVSYWLEAHSDRFAAKGRSVGWYRQQYLKLAYSWKQDNSCFIHDGDTIFSPDLIRRLCKYRMLLATHEDPRLYDLGCTELGINVNNCPSFVANGGLFSGQLLRSLSGDPAEWFITSMELILKHPGNADFSEYQIMGNLFNISNPIIQIHNMRLFRRMDLLADSIQELPPQRLIIDALDRYDAIAFERNHSRSTARRYLAYLMYRIGWSW